MPQFPHHLGETLGSTALPPSTLCSDDVQKERLVHLKGEEARVQDSWLTSQEA